MAGYNATQRGSDTIPLSSVQVPGSATPVPLQGSTLTNTDANGNTTAPMNVNVVQTNSTAIQMAGADGMTAANVEMEGTALWNGATFDQQRNNMNLGALITASGATSTQTSPDQTNHNGKGVVVVLDMTTVGTGNVTLTIQGKDTASGKYYTLLAGAAVTTNVTNTYTVYPGITATANVSASNIVPRVWRIQVTANNANATTYTAGACLIL